MNQDETLAKEFLEAARNLVASSGNIEPYLLPSFDPYDYGLICRNGLASLIRLAYWQKAAAGWRVKAATAAKHELVDGLIDQFESLDESNVRPGAEDLKNNRLTVLLDTPATHGASNPAIVATHDDLSRFIGFFTKLAESACDLARELSDVESYAASARKAHARPQVIAVCEYLLGHKETAIAEFDQLIERAPGRMRSNRIKFRDWLMQLP